MKNLFAAMMLVLSFLVTSSFAQPDKPAAATAAEAPPPQSKQTAAAAGISYGIVVDNSGSYRQILEYVIEATKNLVEANAGEDETFLVRFVSSDKIKLMQNFTASKDEIHLAADDMFVEGGLTAILDAVDFSARHLAEKGGGSSSSNDAARPKILVLITDGDDRQSTIKIESVLKFLKDNQIRVFALGLSEEKVSTKILDRLTKETGGKKFVPKTRAELPATVKEIAAAIRVR